MKIKITWELILIAAFVLTGICHSLFFKVPFWVYLTYAALYLIFEMTGLNDEEL